MKRFILAALAAATLSSPAWAQTSGPAVAALQPTASHQAHGTVWFVAQNNGKVHIVARLEGLQPGSEHGFHIHEYGDETASDGSSAGGHYNPGNEPHAGPEAAAHHAGDLGNVRADSQGVAYLDMTVSDLTLDAIMGRAVVLHARADDLHSQPSGDAGDRIAVGTIGLANPKTMQAMNQTRVKLGSPTTTDRVGIPYLEVLPERPRTGDLHDDRNLQNMPVDGTDDRRIGPNDDIRDFPIHQ